MLKLVGLMGLTSYKDNTLLICLKEANKGFSSSGGLKSKAHLKLLKSWRS